MKLNVLDMISKKADYKEQHNVKLRKKSATWEEEEIGGSGSRKGGKLMHVAHFRLHQIFFAENELH